MIILPEAARDMLLGLPVFLETETLRLLPALERVLAEDICALFSVPPFDRSPFDGWAFRGEDTRTASKDKPVRLSITEEIPAGGFPKMEVTREQPRKSLPEHLYPRAQTQR
jgi:molybdopterin molybdotransferase